MSVGMRIGSVGFGRKAGAQMRVGAVRVEPKIVETSQPEKKVIKRSKDEWGALTPLSISKLKNIGYTSITDFAGKTEAELLEIPGIGKAVATKILEFNS